MVKPRPASRTSSTGIAPSRTSTSNASPRLGVAEHVLDEGVDHRRDRILPKSDLQVALSDIHAELTVLLLGEHLPERGPVGNNRPKITFPGRPISVLPRFFDELVDSLLDPIDLSDEDRSLRRVETASACSRRAVSGVRSRCDRSATDSRSSASN